MKRLTCLIPLSVIAVLMFVSVAMAQSSPDQSSLGQYGSGQSSSLGQYDPNQGVQTTNNHLVSVDIEPSGFYRAHTSIDPGTTVKWLNVDTKPHTVTAYDGSFDSGELKPGQSFSFTFDGPGTWAYYSTLDPDMKGSVIVGGASGGEATTPVGSASDPMQTANDATPADGSTQTTGEPTPIGNGS